jgi:hypothetical protein
MKTAKAIEPGFGIFNLSACFQTAGDVDLLHPCHRLIGCEAKALLGWLVPVVSAVTILRRDRARHDPLAANL